MNTLGTVILVITLLILACSVVLMAVGGRYVDQSVAVKAAETMGFTEVQVIDRDNYFVPFKGGGSGDVVRFTVTGVNPRGERVEFCVFAGWLFKGATLRFK